MVNMQMYGQHGPKVVLTYVSVSYTHLDVYKRQRLYIRWFELNVLITTKLLKISDMYNFLLIFINLN